MHACTELRVNSSRNVRHVDRKTNRISHRLQKFGLTLSDLPCSCVVLANCGLANDVTAEQVTDLLKSRCAPFPDELVCPLGRTYCLLFFESVECAVATQAAMHLCQLDTPDLPCRLFVKVYAFFATKIPEMAQFREVQELPSGLLLLSDYVTEEEEAQLLKCVDWQSAAKELRHRRVRHYGYEFEYGSNSVDCSKPLLTAPFPSECQSILMRLASENHTPLAGLPNQLTVNEYQPGQGIPLHVDTHSQFEEPLIILSLGHAVCMQFREERNDRNLEIDLPRRSVLLLSGEARFLWLHGIAARKSDLIPSTTVGNLTLRRRSVRTSFTFRLLRSADSGPCTCSFSEQCDSQKKQQQQLRLNQLEDNPAAVEHQFVHSVYEEIGKHFSSTRHAHWPAVAEFLDSLPSGALVADMGCGNGKYLARRAADCFVVGLELSASLCLECARRPNYLQILRGDVLAPALRSSIWDASISVAVLHHLASASRRLAALSCMADLLRPGGLGLVTVWAMNQHDGNHSSHYVNRTTCNTLKSEIIDNLKDYVPIHASRTSFTAPDMLVPWTLPKSGGSVPNIRHRYYHLFCEGELDELVKQTACLHIVRSFYDDGNWCVIFQKEMSK